MDILWLFVALLAIVAFKYLLFSIISNALATFIQPNILLSTGLVIGFIAFFRWYGATPGGPGTLRWMLTPKALRALKP